MFTAGQGYTFYHHKDRTFSSGDVKFYQWKDFFTKLSETIEGLFTVTGQGEDTGDYWRAFIRDGKCYEITPQFPDFDESKLR